MANEFKVKKGLIVQGSGSVILDIQGSQGQLFSVTDNLSGSLFSVNDISGLPILQVSSDDSVKLGTFNAEAIKVSGSVAIITGSFSGSFSGNAFVQNGNSFGATAVLGTNDIQSLALETSGSTRLFVSSSGNVGIGTTTPGDVLTVNGNIRPVASTDTGIYGFDAATGGSKIYSITRATSMNANDLNINAYNGFGIKVNSPSLVKSGHEFFISSSGNVGIGTTAPVYKLDVSGSGRFTDGLTVTGSMVFTGDITGSNALFTGTITAQKLVVQTVTSSILYSSGSNKFGNDLTNTHQFTGSVYITGSSFNFNNGIGTYTLSGYNFIAPSSFLIQASAGYLKIYNPATAIQLGASTGYTGIGPAFLTSQAPSAILHVSGASNQPLYLIESPAAPGALFVSGSGNVGIGTTSPAQTLHVVGTMRYGNLANTNYLEFNQIGGGTQILSNSGKEIYFYPEGNSGIGIIKTATGAGMSIGVSYFTTTPPDNGLLVQGNVGIGTSGSVGRLFVNSLANAITDLTNVRLYANTFFGGYGGSNFDYGLAVGMTATAPIIQAIQLTSASADLSLQPYGGNVGIGVQSPVYRLRVDASGSANSNLPLALTSIDTNNRVGILFGSSSLASGKQHKLFHRVHAATVEWILDTPAASSANWNFLPTDDSSYAVNIIAPFATGGDARLYAAPKHRSLTLSAGGSNDHLIILSGSGNVGIGTTAPTAKLHVNGSAIITGSLTIGSSSLGSTENTLALGPPMAGGLGEGGQILLQASGGLYTSASMLDNWQNTFRILRGTNASSDATVANWNLHTKQMQLPQYTNASSFVGTATANLAVDSGGNIITVSTSGGSVFPYTGNAVITGSLTTTGVIYAQPNGGMYFQGGDDVALYDINISNHIGIYGVQDSTVGSIKLGSGGGVISGKNNNIGIGTLTPNAKLDVAGSITASGSLTVTGSVTITGAMNSGNVQINSGAWLYWGNGTTIQSPSTNALTFINTAGTAYSSLTTGNTLVTGSLTVTNGINVTGSLAFTGDITGSNAIFSGTITAQKLVVQTITSSVLYSSGSNIFGNNISNTQVFTGSLYQTGSTAAFMGNVGIGTTTPNARLDVSGSAIISGSLTVTGNGLFSQQLTVAGALNGGQYYPQTSAQINTIYGGRSDISTTGIAFNTITPSRTIMIINYVGNVGIGTTAPSASLHVAGTTILSSSFNTAISGSTLKVQGSGSTQPIFTVVGSQGELFSITDSLSGSLFSVNDISGLPILEVFSDNTILLGNYQAPTLYTTNRIASTALGSNVIYSLPTSSYDGVFMDYTVKSGSNARAGNFAAIWSGTAVNYMDNSTTDFGSTAGMVLSGSISGSNLVVFASGSSAGWTFKGIIKSI